MQNSGAKGLSVGGTCTICTDVDTRCIKRAHTAVRKTGYNWKTMNV